MTGISIDFMAAVPQVMAPPPVPAAAKAGFASLVAGLTAAYAPPAATPPVLPEELAGDVALPLDRQDLAGGDAGAEEDSDNNGLIIVDLAFLAPPPVVAVPVVPAPVIGASPGVGPVRGEAPDISPVTARQSPAQAPAIDLVQPGPIETAEPQVPAEDPAPTSLNERPVLRTPILERPLPQPEEISTADRATIAKVIAAARDAAGQPATPPAPAPPAPVNPQPPIAMQPLVAPTPVVQRSAPIRTTASTETSMLDAEGRALPVRDAQAPQSVAPVAPAVVFPTMTTDEPAQPVTINADAPAPAAMILPTSTPAAPMPIREVVIGDRPYSIDTGRADWIETLVDRIDEARGHGGGNRITQLRLLPDALGTVDVRIEQNGDRVNVHFTADTAQARTLLADATSRLSDLADARGLKLGDTGVQQGPGGQRNAERDQQQARPNPAPIMTESDTAVGDAADRLA